MSRGREWELPSGSAAGAPSVRDKQSHAPEQRQALRWPGGRTRQAKITSMKVPSPTSPRIKVTGDRDGAGTEQRTRDRPVGIAWRRAGGSAATSAERARPLWPRAPPGRAPPEQSARCGVSTAACAARVRCPCVLSGGTELLQTENQLSWEALEVTRREGDCPGEGVSVRTALQLWASKSGPGPTFQTLAETPAGLSRAVLPKMSLRAATRASHRWPVTLTAQACSTPHPALLGH